MDDPCLICGHDRDQHPPNHFAMFGWHCKVVGCSCGQFERTGPAATSTPTGALAGPPDRHRFRPVLGELEDLCHCVTCGLPRDHATHDPPVAGPPDLAHAIQAATKALNVGFDWDDYDVHDVACLAVEAAWPHAEGTIANAWAKVNRQREANAAMQRQADDARATARGAMRKQLDLETKLQAARDRLADLEVYAAQARVLARWAAAQPCQCEDVAYPGSGGPSCASCDAKAFLNETHPPARGRTILEEVERYHVYQRALALQVLAYRRAALDTPAERNALQGLLEIVEGFEDAAGDLGAAQEEGSGG